MVVVELELTLSLDVNLDPFGIKMPFWAKQNKLNGKNLFFFSVFVVNFYIMFSKNPPIFQELIFNLKYAP